tara:strand:+ start:776 stop:1162 length:387 start_codon:yes stop_codon:yes gene_type:complete
VIDNYRTLNMTNRRGIFVVRSLKDLMWAFEKQEVIEIRDVNAFKGTDIGKITLRGTVQKIEYEDGSGKSFVIRMYVHDQFGRPHTVEGHVCLKNGKPKRKKSKKARIVKNNHEPGTWRGANLRDEESE